MPCGAWVLTVGSFAGGDLGGFLLSAGAQEQGHPRSVRGPLVGYRGQGRLRRLGQAIGGGHLLVDAPLRGREAVRVPRAAEEYRLRGERADAGRLAQPLEPVLRWQGAQGGGI